MFLAYWAKVHKLPLNTVVEDYCSSPIGWEKRYSNYNYSLLFKIRKGRGKGGIQKYYAGWNTYLKLANGNIRYLLELIYSAFERHIEDGNELLHIENPFKADPCKIILHGNHRLSDFTLIIADFTLQRNPYVVIIKLTK